MVVTFINRGHVYITNIIKYYCKVVLSKTNYVMINELNHEQHDGTNLPIILFHCH